MDYFLTFLWLIKEIVLGYLLRNDEKNYGRKFQVKLLQERFRKNHATKYWKKKILCSSRRNSRRNLDTGDTLAVILENKVQELPMGDYRYTRKKKHLEISKRSFSWNSSLIFGRHPRRSTEEIPGETSGTFRKTSEIIFRMVESREKLFKQLEIIYKRIIRYYEQRQNTTTPVNKKDLWLEAWYVELLISQFHREHSHIPVESRDGRTIRKRYKRASS